MKTKMPKSKVKKAKTGKHPGGRPTKYKPEYCKKIIEFFSKQPIRFIDGKPYANELPFLTAFAREIDVDIDTMEEWTKKHVEFSGAYKRAKELQKEFLINNGLVGLYNSTFAIFTAKNITEMRDVKEHDIGGSLHIHID